MHYCRQEVDGPNLSIETDAELASFSLTLSPKECLNKSTDHAVGVTSTLVSRQRTPSAALAHHF
jgi:hypothetical protein